MATNDVLGFEGIYKISCNGDLYSIKRNKFIKPQKRGKYLFNSLYKNGASHQLSIHRIVAVAFIDNPMNKPCVNHKDGNKYNNNYSNLEWCTKSENTKHAFSTGLMNVKKGERINVSKLSNNDIPKIKELSKNLSSRKVAKIFNVSKSCIQHVINGKTWGAVK